LKETTIFRSGATGDFFLHLEAGLFGREGGRDEKKERRRQKSDVEE